ncbi:amidohydrolase family protein [Shewanella sp. JM162201]|uniref:Amidohydrolase family protein n=1 Tax=Shewanella jiangmenensis TaxID=2837387 RepID=A0ABS5V4R0_9GAMM|nr:amidohydrolase family protein [Shewanella jiangmenensis]MBT1444791.1 amidohydrolase family protein [Shewanella jiangmenensis]
MAINRNSLIFLLLGSACCSLSLEAKTLLTAEPERLIALQGARLHLAPGQTLEQGTLVIQGNRIKAVLDGIQTPAGANVIDMKGLDIYPGFIDPFTEYGIGFEYPKQEKDAPVYEIGRIGGNAANGAIHAEKQWAHFFAPNKESAEAWVNNGFTSVHSAKFDGIFRGTGVHVSLADKIANDVIYSERGNSFLSFDKGSSIQDYPNSLMGAIALIRQTLMDASWYQQNKRRLASDNQPGTLEFNAALDAIGEPNQTFYIFDTPDLNNQLRASRLMKEFTLSGALLGNGQEYARLNEIKVSGASVILPLNFPAAPDVSSPETEQQLKLAELRHWEYAPKNLSMLSDAGVSFALTLHGIDDKKDFWPRLKKALDAGLEEQAALAALTTDAAKIAGIDKFAGKLSPGFIADLAVYSGNPFKDGKLVSVFLMGEETALKPREQLALAGRYELGYQDKRHAVKLDVNHSPDGSFELAFEEPANTNTNASVDTNAAADSKPDSKSESAPSPIKLAGRPHELTGRAALPGIDGKARIILDLRAKKGTATLADGSVIALSLTHVTEAKAAATAKADAAKTDASGDEKAKAKADANKALIGKLTSPNVAFGLSSAPAQDKVHIQGATLWTSEADGILENTDLIISKGRILKIGQNLMTPPGFTKIDARGKHLTAGIVDEHSHIALNGGTNEDTDAVTSEVRIGDVLNPDDIALYRSLAGGVTTAQLLHGSANPIGGQSQLIKLRWGETAEGLKYEGAPGSIKFALGENVKQSNWGDDYTTRFPQSRMGVEAAIADAFDAARQHQADIAAFEKLSSSEQKARVSPRPNLRLDALSEVLASKRDVHIHSYVQSEILMFLRLAEAYGFKVKAFTHVLEGYKVAKELAAHGAGASTFSDWWAYKFEVYDAIVENACLMQQQGVLTSLNSDSFEMQRRLNQEAAKSMMYCNMSAEDAWKMITINPAIQLGIEKDTGSLKEGKVADIVLWDAHPMSVYARTEMVWVDGKRHFDRELDRQMQAEQAAERRALINKILTLDEEGRSGEAPKAAQSEPEWHCDTHFEVFKTGISTQQSTQHSHGAH